MDLKFEVREEDGMLIAECDEPDMSTQGRNMDELVQNVCELIASRFDEGDPLRAANPRFTFYGGAAAYGLEYIAAAEARKRSLN